MKQKSQKTEKEERPEAERQEMYVCIGSVRGWCGHRHKSIAKAIKCIERDGQGCKTQGGYSDRLTYRLSDVREKGDRVWLPSSTYVRPVDTFEVEE